ncbi:MAG: glycine cleavage system protein H [Bacteroidota bacterium]
MSAILALITAIILVVVSLVRSRGPKESRSPSIIKRYVHPGHAWARTTEDGYVVVGVDDFTQSLMGEITAVSMPRLLGRVFQGKASWELVHGGRSLRMVSPVTGWVVEKNEAILRDPSLINSSPYGEGWLLKLKSYKLKPQLNNLLSGRAARQCRDAVQTRLSQFFTGTPALLMQDGGVMMNDLAARCSDEEWETITKEFFLTA